jgi:hypothetical protein
MGRIAFRQFKVFSMIAAMVVAAGCGTTREAQYDTTKTETATENTDAANLLVEEGDALWAERSDKEKLIAAIAKWEEASSQAPSGDLYLKLARGNYFLADGHYSVEGDEAKRDEHYTIGLGFAEKATGVLAPEFVSAVQGGEKHATAILKAPPEAVPALYWQATNLGKWAASKGFATKLKYKDDIEATMLHVKSLDESYYYSAPFRYFGAFEAATAGLAGGSLEKSEENFQIAVERAPTYLGTKVLWAEYLCTKTQDKETYERLLKEVLAADAAVDPAIEPENRAEQRKAQKLLDRMDEEF